MLRKLFKFFFSRYTISALMIAAEIGLLLYLILSMSAYSVVFLVEVLIVNALIVIAIVNSECNPEHRLSWMAAVTLLPIFGALLYAIFHTRGMSAGDERRAHAAMEALSELDGEEEDREALRAECPLACGKARSIMLHDRAASLYRAESKYYSSGAKMYEDMIESMRGAKSFIFLEYFIIARGEMWQGMLEVLRERIASGVEVRLLFDDIGCMKTLSNRHERELVKMGIRAIRFSPASPRVSAVHNNRDHRKICIVDGKVAFTGGVNIADEYIGKKERFGIWKDGGVSVRGAAVHGFTKLFLSMWAMASKKEEKYDKYFPICKEKITDFGYYIPFGSGPAPLYSGRVGQRAFTDIINQAERYVYITTPYLIIDHDLTAALTGAAERGVDVRIITPGIADKRLIKVMTKSSYSALIRAGVKIFEYTPGFIHEKLMVSDDLYAVIGTINLDYRSLVHHFEDALWIYSSPTVIAARDSFINIQSVSREIDTQEAGLGFFEWLVKCCMRIFAPLL